MKNNSLVAAAILFLTFLKFVAIGTIVVLPWSNTDEIGHYSYVMEIARGNFMPEHGVARMDPAATESQFGEPGRPMNYILSHPPLYYYTLAPVGFVLQKLSNDPVFILLGLRVANSLIGALGVMMIYLTARALRLSQTAALITAGIVAVNPMFGSLSGGLSNDVAVFTLSSIGAWCLAHHLTIFRWRYELGCFAAFMAATLTKSTTMPIMLGMVVLLAAYRIYHGRMQIKAVLVLLIASIPLFLWHLLSYIHYGSWIRLGSLKTVDTLSPADHPLWKFLTETAVVDTVMSTFYGFIWLRTSAIRMIERPTDFLLLSYALFLGVLILGTGLAVVLDKRFNWPNHRKLQFVTIAVSLLAALGTAYAIAADYWSVKLVIGGLTFLGIFALFNSFRILSSEDPGVKFSLVAFAAFFCLAVVAMYNFYEVYLIHGRPRALHGRYFYSVAPMLLVAMAVVANDLRWRRTVMLGAFACLLAFESFFWNGFANGVYREFDVEQHLVSRAQ